jgi:hypothetical protein
MLISVKSSRLKSNARLGFRGAQGKSPRYINDFVIGLQEHPVTVMFSNPANLYVYVLYLQKLRLTIPINCNYHLRDCRDMSAAARLILELLIK